VREGNGAGSWTKGLGDGTDGRDEAELTMESCRLAVEAGLNRAIRSIAGTSRGDPVSDIDDCDGNRIGSGERGGERHWLSVNLVRVVLISVGVEKSSMMLSSGVGIIFGGALVEGRE